LGGCLLHGGSIDVVERGREQRLRIVWTERMEPQHLGAAVREQSIKCWMLGIAVCRENQQRKPPDLGGQPFEQTVRRRIGPLEIIKDKHHAGRRRMLLYGVQDRGVGRKRCSCGVLHRAVLLLCIAGENPRHRRTRFRERT
jgi:hypothetical protein